MLFFKYITLINNFVIIYKMSTSTSNPYPTAFSTTLTPKKPDTSSITSTDSNPFCKHISKGNYNSSIRELFREFPQIKMSGGGKRMKKNKRIKKSKKSRINKKIKKSRINKKVKKTRKIRSQKNK